MTEDKANLQSESDHAVDSGEQASEVADEIVVKVDYDFSSPVSDFISPNTLAERTPRGARKNAVIMAEGRREDKVLRGMSSRMSRHTMNSFVSDAMMEAIQGLEPLSTYVMRLIRFHRCLILASFIMVFIGVLGGMAIEEWNFLTSMYVIVQIITTIGYGDVTVEKEWMKLFMTFYVVLSLVFVANFLNIFLKTIIERHAEHLHRRLRVHI